MTYDVYDYFELIKLHKGKLLYFDKWDEDAIWINIAGTMLFSHDEDKRHSWVARCFLSSRSRRHQKKIDLDALSYNRACKSLGDDFSVLAMYMGGPERFINILFSKQLNTIESEANERFENGLMCASIFRYALSNLCSLGKAFEWYNDSHSSVRPYRIRSGSHVFNKIYPQYLPSIHFWSAYATFYDYGVEEKLSYEDGGALFCCKERKDQGLDDGLAGFIKLSIAYLMRGINSVPRRRGPKSPLLDPAKLFYILAPNLEFMHDPNRPS